jgi:hypothetical protein
VHRHNDDTGDYGHEAAHHHCTPELARTIINSANPLPGFTGCPQGASHGNHVDFDDGRTLADRLGSYIVSGAFGAGATAVAIALAPVTAGASVIGWASAVAGVVGGGVGGEIWYQLSDDGKVILKMSGKRGCAPKSGWEKKTVEVELAEAAFAGYTTKYDHIIRYCEETVVDS